jgi:hypothetical protein
MGQLTRDMGSSAYDTRAVESLASITSLAYRITQEEKRLGIQKNMAYKRKSAKALQDMSMSLYCQPPVKRKVSILRTGQRSVVIITIIALLM